MKKLYQRIIVISTVAFLACLFFKTGTFAIEVNNNTSENYSQEICQLIKDAKYNQALDLANKNIALKPNNASSYFDRGFVNEKMENYNASIADYTRAIEITKPEDLTANNFISRSRCYAQLNKVDSVIKDLNQAVLIEPKKAESYYLLAKIYHEKLKDDKTALKNANIAINLKSDQPRYYSLRSVIFEKLNQQDKADSDIANMMNIEAKTPEDCYYKICYYIMTNDDDQVQEYINKSIKLEPNNYDFFLSIGELYACLNMYSESVVYLKKSLEIRPNYKSYLLLGQDLYHYYKDYPQAIENIKRAIKLQPENYKCYQILGDAYYYAGQNQNSLEAYHKAIKLESQDYHSYSQLGKIYLAMHNNKLADFYFTKELENYKGNDNYEFYFDKGNYFSSENNFTQAIKCYDKAIEIKPESNIYVNRGLAKMYQKVNTVKNLDDAIKDFHCALSLDHENTKAINGILLCKIKCKDINGIISEMSDYLRYNKLDNINECNLLYLYATALSEKSNNKTDLQVAIKIFNKIIKLDPSFRNVHYQLGCAYYNLNSYSGFSRAYDEFKIVVKNTNAKEDYLAETNMYLAKIILRLLICKDALGYLNESANLLSKDNLPLLLRCEYNIAHLNFKAANRDLELVNNNDPNNIKLLELKIIYSFILKKYNDSLKICENILKIGNLSNNNSSELNKNPRIQAAIYGYLSYHYLHQNDKARQFLKRLINAPDTTQNDKKFFKLLLGEITINDLKEFFNKAEVEKYSLLYSFTKMMQNKHISDSDIIKNIYNLDSESVYFIHCLALAKQRNLPLKNRYSKKPNNSKVIKTSTKH